MAAPPWTFVVGCSVLDIRNLLSSPARQRSARRYYSIRERRTGQAVPLGEVAERLKAAPC